MRDLAPLLLLPLVGLMGTLGPAAATGQASPGAQATSASPTGLIVGQVVDETGTPLTDATVRLARSGQPDNVAPNGIVLVDSQGRFVFSQLPPGQYYFEAGKEGYASGGFGQARPGGSASSLTLKPDERRVDVVLKLWKFAAIAGTVVDEAGEPIVGVGVRAMPRTIVGGRPSFGSVDTPFQSPAAVTDDRGRFRFAQLLPGDYVVYVPSTLTTLPVATADATVLDRSFAISLWSSGIYEPAGRGQARALLQGGHAAVNLTTGPPPRQLANGRLLVYPGTYFPSAATPFEATAVAVKIGETRADVTITMRAVPAVRVSGRLVTPDGGVPPPMSIKLSGSASGGVIDSDLSSGTPPLGLYDAAVAMSDADGRFTLLGVPAGEYVIRHARRILYPAVDAGTGYWIAQPLTVGADDVDDVVVTLRPAVRVEGRIDVASGLDPAHLPAVLARGAVSFQTSRGEPGRGAAELRSPNGPRTFGSAGISGGRIVVDPVETQGWVVESISLEGKDITDRAVDVASDITTLVVTYTNRVSPVSGAARSRRGGGSPGAMVVAFPTDDTRWVDYGPEPRRVRSTYADAQGAWAFAHLPPDEYYIAALESEDPHLWRDPARLKVLAGRATRITVAAGSPTAIDLTVLESVR